MQPYAYHKCDFLLWLQLQRLHPFFARAFLLRDHVTHKIKVLTKGHYFILSKLFAISCTLPHRINLQGLQPASWTFGRAAGSYEGYCSGNFMTILIILSSSSMSYYLRPWNRLGVFYVLKVSEANKLWRRGKQKTESEKNTFELA